MKKLIALLLTLVMVLSFAACAKTEAPAEDTTEATEANTTETTTEVVGDPVAAAMTHEEYIAAEIDAEVVIETYVQATQSWWDNKITVYCQSPDGAYFLYELACSEEDAAKLVPGTKIRVTGFKGEWAGEVEVMDGTFEFVEGDTYIAEATDVTELLGTEELIAHQNEFVSFTGMSVVGIEYKNGEPGDDIYVTLAKNGATYSFCVERYLTGPETEVYTTVGTLQVGDIIDVEGFLYWYETVNTHITSVTVTGSAMTHEEYLAAEIDAEVNLVTFVQDWQSWWDNKITLYCQNEEGACFVYEAACSEEVAGQLTSGAMVLINGFKGEWAGEIEVMDATFVIVPNEFYTPEPLDATPLLGTDEMIAHQNEVALFTGMTVKAIEYKNGEPGDDIYVTLSKDGADYNFCVERYLTAPDSEVYTTVGDLQVGDTVDVLCFLYWYETMNPHIIHIAPAA